MPAKTQDDLVREEQGYQPREVTRKISVPGLESLHQKPTIEIAEMLALVLRSEPNIIELRYRVGEFIELTSRVH